MKNIPRSEYPRPQFERASWQTLNGAWTYELDPGKSGDERGLTASQGFGAQIIVPFCPESKLSGVQHLDFIEQMYYHRKVTFPKAWKGQRILLHFGAVDYDCTVFVDGQSVGRHVGGSASFECDVTALAKPGKPQNLVVKVVDNQRTSTQPFGKQCFFYRSAGCSYTRTTGIWQSVWMEAVAPCGLKACQTRPNLDDAQFVFLPEFYADQTGNTLTITAADPKSGKVLGAVTGAAASGVPLTLDLKKAHAWSPKDPYLYDLKYEVRDAKGQILDTVAGYAGLRKISIVGNQFLLNNQPLFLRLVLDQGFYPDGIWTAPTDEALKHDIELSMAAGFNGARLHQKVFEARFHYWADKLGYLTWSESPSWGMAFDDSPRPDALSVWQSFSNFMCEWTELVQQAFNSPSVIAWTPLNETSCTHGDLELFRLFEARVYDLTKALDPTRPCNETSGYVHAKTDLWTVHLYRKDAKELKEATVPADGAPVYMSKNETGYHGQPYILDEIGGFKYIPPKKGEFNERSWGYYGMSIKNADEYCALIDGQIRLLESLPQVAGFCYTQLTDVEQEQNGVYNYDRSLKVPVAKLAKAFGAGKLTR